MATTRLENTSAIFSEADLENKNNVDKFYFKDSSVAGFAKNYLEYIGEVLNNISVTEIEEFIETLLNARNNDASIYFIGNGGSAATASHFANDIAIGTRSWAKPFRVTSLCDNLAVITAIANDDGYEYIFSQQLEVLLKKDDIVIAISASGNSPNLIRAIDVAKKMGAKTVGLSAFDGGKLRSIVDVSVHVPTGPKEYGPAEDGHIVLNHLVGAYLMRLIQDQ